MQVGRGMPVNLKYSYFPLNKEETSKNKTRARDFYHHVVFNSASCTHAQIFLFIARRTREFFCHE
jgi:hypothetical protein